MSFASSDSTLVSFENVPLNCLVPLPVGWQDRPCPNCRIDALTGALITPSADRNDPDIVCLSCGASF